MDSNDADFFTRKNRNRPVNRLKLFDTIECFSEKDRTVLYKQSACPCLQSVVTIHRCKKTNTLETNEAGNYRANVDNKREKAGKTALDYEKSSVNLSRNDSLYINSDILKSMHTTYRINEDSLLSYEYKGLVTDSTRTNCFNYIHLNDEHHGERGNCSFFRKTLLVRKPDSNTFCKRNVNRSTYRETSIFTEHSNSKEEQIDALPFLCNVCMRRFKRLSSLKLHIFSHIYHVDIFECPMFDCSTNFKDMPSTIDHIRLTHSTFEEALIAIAKDQRWTYNFKCFLALNDFYALIKQEDKNVFRNAFCFECFTFPVSFEMHPCSRKYSTIPFCPACSLAILPGTLKKHCFGSECKRKAPIIKRIF